AEQRHDRVADEFLDGAAAPLELDAHPLPVRLEQRAHVLRVEPLGPRREPDQVDEQDGDDLALLARLGVAERAAAPQAEARVLGVLLAAAIAGDHAASVGRKTPSPANRGARR